jgi:GNAT superfamily N-acetyltransferase
VAAVASRSGLSRIVRPAAAEDLDALTRTHLAAFRAGNGPLLPRRVLRQITTERMRDRWRSQIESPAPGTLLLVAELGGAIVGTATSGPPRDDEVDAATTGELYSLYVQPRGWGAGHGSALHDAALAHLGATGLHRAMLWVLERNARACAFYAARGWSADGGRSEWEGTPVVRLAREL